MSSVSSETSSLNFDLILILLSVASTLGSEPPQTKLSSARNLIDQKKEIQKQIEFYFSDINLINDKYMRTLISMNSEGIEIKIFLKFNKIKTLLEDFENESEKSKFIKKALENSKKLKVVSNKIIRIEKFSIKNINQKEIDDRMVYIENIPLDISHETLNQIFSNFGKVIHISIPKIAKLKKPKGFAFITFENSSEANQAIILGNNSIPKEFISVKNSSLDPMIVMSKLNWTEKKEEFKLLKTELQREKKNAYLECSSQNSKNINNLTPGTLVRLTNLPEKINRNQIKIWASNFVEPAYVDYEGEICVLRFSEKDLALKFLEKINLEDGVKHDFFYWKVKGGLIEGEEETIYFDKVRKAREEFKLKVKNIK